MKIYRCCCGALNDLREEPDAAQFCVGCRMESPVIDAVYLVVIAE